MSHQETVQNPVGKRELRELAKRFENINELKFLWMTPEEELEVEPIARGDVNYNYRVYSKGDPSKSVFVKHGAAHCKNVPDSPLPVQRVGVEYHSVCYCHEAIPSSVPAPYLYSAESNIAMYELLEGYEDLEAVIVAGTFNPQTFTALAKTLGQLHHKTHKNTLKDSFKNLEDKVRCKELQDLTNDFYFNSGFADEASLAQLKPEHVKRSADFRADASMRAALEQVRAHAQLKECLIHNDLHFNSVMVKNHEPRLIDFEFARLGNPARDVGMVLAQLMALYYFHLLTPTNNPYHRQLAYKLRHACDNFMQVYFEHMRAFSEPEEEFKRRMARHVSGFVGVELVNRVLSTPHIPNIQSAGHATSVETEMLECGLRVLRKHADMDSVHKMFFIGFMEC